MNEKAEFEKNCKNNKSFIISVLRRYVKDQGAVEDLAQQTFINAWIARNDFQGRSSYKTWLYRIAVNVTFTYLLKQKHQVKVLNDDLSNFESSVTSLHYIYATPLHSVAAERDFDALKGKIEKLPKQMQQALVMFAIYGIPYDEIADALNIPIGTVRSRIHRARAMLAEDAGYLLDK